MKKFDVVEWMAENGHPSYLRDVTDLRVAMFALARRDKTDSPIIDGILKEIKEIYVEAHDRYDDWRTDLLD